MREKDKGTEPEKGSGGGKQSLQESAATPAVRWNQLRMVETTARYRLVSMPVGL